MATPIIANPTNDDSDDNPRQHKKGRDIQPLNEESLKKQLENDKELQKANSDVLAELAARAAELAERVKGPESPKERVLRLDEPEEANPTDIFTALEEKTPKKFQNTQTTSPDATPAVELIRAKLNKLYDDEPDATEEAAEAVASGSHRSKHQQFMYNLTTSGKSLADIQTAWHNYYVALSDDEKHDVWQEFYVNQSSLSSYAKHQKKTNTNHKKPEPKHSTQTTAPTKQKDTRDTVTIRNQIKEKVSAGGKLKPIHHFKSALFGLGLAGIVGLAITFVFFNEVFVAPFISPSKTVSATPIIGDQVGEIGQESKIIIPKINLEVPVVYGLNSIEEDTIQDALEDGVVHYAATPEPGQIGNSVIVGHSSNNILNSGKYKFAFVLLRRLEKDDIFFIHKEGIRYTYKVFDKKVVPPTDVSVLGPTERTNTMTLITCDPPGTSVNRLIIVAEQISPDPAKNTEANINIEQTDTQELPSNAPSLWSRLTGWL
jgi:LPXTG-site transpeptidase (sortase) family protein